MELFNNYPYYDNYDEEDYEEEDYDYDDEDSYNYRADTNPKPASASGDVTQLCTKWNKCPAGYVLRTKAALINCSAPSGENAGVTNREMPTVNYVPKCSTAICCMDPTNPNAIPAEILNKESIKYELSLANKNATKLYKLLIGLDTGETEVFKSVDDMLIDPVQVGGGSIVIELPQAPANLLTGPVTVGSLGPHDTSGSK